MEDGKSFQNKLWRNKDLTHVTDQLPAAEEDEEEECILPDYPLIGWNVPPRFCFLFFSLFFCEF